MPFFEGGLTTRSKMFRPKKRLQITVGTADKDQSAASESEKQNTPARSGSGAPTTNEDSGTAAERTTS